MILLRIERDPLSLGRLNDFPLITTRRSRTRSVLRHGVCNSGRNSIRFPGIVNHSKTRRTVDELVATAVELQWNIAREGKDIGIMWAQPGDSFDPNWMEDVRPAAEEDEPESLAAGGSDPLYHRLTKNCIAFGIEGPTGVVQKCLVVLEG